MTSLPRISFNNKFKPQYIPLTTLSFLSSDSRLFLFFINPDRKNPLFFVIFVDTSRHTGTDCSDRKNPEFRVDYLNS